MYMGYILLYITSYHIFVHVKSAYHLPICLYVPLKTDKARMDCKSYNQLYNHKERIYTAIFKLAFMSRLIMRYKNMIWSENYKDLTIMDIDALRNEFYAQSMTTNRKWWSMTRSKTHYGPTLRSSHVVRLALVAIGFKEMFKNIFSCVYVLMHDAAFVAASSSHLTKHDDSCYLLK